MTLEAIANNIDGMALLFFKKNAISVRFKVFISMGNNRSNRGNGTCSREYLS